MLSLETRSRSRDISRPDFYGLGLSLVGPGLGLGFVGPGLGLVGSDLGLARSGLDVKTETEISSKNYIYKKCRPTRPWPTASEQQDCYRREFVVFKPSPSVNLAQIQWRNRQVGVPWTKCSRRSLANFLKSNFLQK